MHIQLKLTAASVAAALVLVGSSVAQQTTPTAPKPATATSSTATKPGTTATKPRTASSASSTAPLTLKTQKDKLSYAIGMNIGEGMKRDALDLNPAILTRALRDALAGNKLLMTDAESKTVLDSFRAEMIKKKQEEAKRVGDANKQAGEKFLAENKTKAGVVTLPSGLQYKILKQGEGPKPTATDTVTTNYRGTTIDGKEFDSSYKSGQPATFPVSGVIKGWTEALQLMPVGSKWQLFIPSNLAYGERSPSPDIGPDSTLVFEVELVSIAEKKDQKTDEKKQ